VDLSVRGGEVLAVAGVSGNGQATLAEVLCGERALDSGSLHVPAGCCRRGRVPLSTPAWRGCPKTATPWAWWATWNCGKTPCSSVTTCRLFRRGLARRRAAVAHADGLISRFDVRGTEDSGVHTTTRRLSGGNMQKLILGRVLGHGRGARR
jgi:ABC-type uncharacterized transport system ATPase subunit